MTTEKYGEKPAPDGPFDAALDEWRAWQEAPWGRLRYEVAEFNLQRRLAPLGPGPLRVLDLAGADGGDAVRLLRRGHHVTVVDFSPGMLAAARERARADGTDGRLATVEADVLELPEAVSGSRYDIVLCHNLLQYVDDPAPVVRTAVRLVRERGLLSLMAINRHAAPLSLAVRSLDPAAALASLGERKTRAATFDADQTLHTAEEITALLADAGCADIEHCGIRCVQDHITDDARKLEADFYEALQALEIALTNRHPYPHTAKIFQLLARAGA